MMYLKVRDAMKRLTREKQAQIVSALIEGNSIRSTSRMFGVSKWPQPLEPAPSLRLGQALSPFASLRVNSAKGRHVRM